MDRDHKIRVLVSKLKGKERQEAIDKYLQSPELLSFHFIRFIRLMRQSG